MSCSVQSRMHEYLSFEIRKQEKLNCSEVGKAGKGSARSRGLQYLCVKDCVITHVPNTGIGET